MEMACGLSDDDVRNWAADGTFMMKTLFDASLAEDEAGEIVECAECNGRTIALPCALLSQLAWKELIFWRPRACTS